MESPPYISTRERKLPKTCWKCGSRLVVRGRGLYCESCQRYRFFLGGYGVHWKRGGGGVEEERRYNQRQVARSVAKKLQILTNRAWSKMQEVRLEEGDATADELEDAIQFVVGIMEECKLLAW